jgi:hypothetical protein
MEKMTYMLGMIIGSTIGGYVPMIFGAGLFSGLSLLGSLVGGLFGIWLIYHFTSS